MTNPPRVSVVINNYNYGRFLASAIDSVLAQSYSNVELVVVDDGSTDDSAAVLARYDGQCTVVHQDRGGQGAAYNAGFVASTGDIVLFLDADDELAADAVAAVVDAWTPPVAKVQFAMDIVDGDGRPTGQRMPNLPFATGSVMPLLRWYGYYPAPPGSGNAYARPVLEKLLPMDAARWRKGADGYTIALAALYGDVVSLDRSLGRYRVHGDNQSEAGTIDLGLLRRRMDNDLTREQELKKHAAAQSRPIDAPLALNIPQHCKTRLISLRLDPGSHPYRQDRVGRMALAGIRASWRFPHSRLRKRVLATAGFLALTIMPKRWIAGALVPLFRSETRWDHLSGWLHRRPST